MTTVRLVAVSGNVTSPSRTRVLTGHIVQAVESRAAVETDVIELSEIGPLLGSALTRDALSPTAAAAVSSIESADILVVASPVYRASYTGLFKHLFDFVGYDALAGVPVILAATGGSERHSLAIDHQLRPLFAFFRAYSVPTGVYATEADFEGYTLRNQAIRDRIDAAALEAVRLAGQRLPNLQQVRAVA